MVDKLALYAALLAEKQASFLPFSLLICIPVFAGALSIGWLASQYFLAVSRNPSIESELGPRLLVIIGIIEAPILACLGLGFLFISTVPYLSGDVQLEGLEIESSKQTGTNVRDK